MAFSTQYTTIPGLKATATLAAKQYYVVQVSSTAGEVKVGTSATSKIIGVVQNDPAAGEAALVAAVGIAKCAAETSVAYGDFLTCSSTGRVKTTTSNNNFLVGKALAASSAAGDIIPVLLSIGAVYGA